MWQRIKRLFRGLYRWWLGPASSSPAGQISREDVQGAGRHAVETTLIAGAAMETTDWIDQALPTPDLMGPLMNVVMILVVKFGVSLIRKRLKHYAPVPPAPAADGDATVPADR